MPLSDHVRCGGETIENAIQNDERPPMFIYKSVHACKWAHAPNGVQEGAPAGMLFTAQKSDWIDKDLYLRWVNEVFLKQIPEE